LQYRVFTTSISSSPLALPCSLALTRIYIARSKDIRVPMAWCAMMFPVGHAMVHVIDCIAMNANLDRWLTDLVPVHGTALLYIMIVEAVSRPKNGIFSKFIIP